MITFNFSAVPQSISRKRTQNDFTFKNFFKGTAQRMKSQFSIMKFLSFSKCFVAGTWAVGGIPEIAIITLSFYDKSDKLIKESLNPCLLFRPVLHLSGPLVVLDATNKLKFIGNTTRENKRQERQRQGTKRWEGPALW